MTIATLSHEVAHEVVYFLFAICGISVLGLLAFDMWFVLTGRGRGIFGGSSIPPPMPFPPCEPAKKPRKRRRRARTRARKHR